MNETRAAERQRKDRDALGEKNPTQGREVLNIPVNWVCFRSDEMCFLPSQPHTLEGRAHLIPAMTLHDNYYDGVTCRVF